MKNKCTFFAIVLAAMVGAAVVDRGDRAIEDAPSAGVFLETTNGVSAPRRFRNRIANTRKVPFIYCSDIFHPAMDPDDHFDLAALFAIDEFDVKALVMDGHIDRKGQDQFNGGGRIPLSQMCAITGQTVPSAVGLNVKLEDPLDTLPNGDPRFLGGVELMKHVLETSEEPVVIKISTGTDLAVLFNRAPELCRKKIRAVYFNAGHGCGGVTDEYNVLLDPVAYTRIFETGLPIYWNPCFGEGRVVGDGHCNFFVLPDQRTVLEKAPIELSRFISYVLRQEKSDPIAWLANGEAAEVPSKKRWMWTPPVLAHAAGRSVYRLPSGEYVWSCSERAPADAQECSFYVYEPARVTVDPQRRKQGVLKVEYGSPDSNVRVFRQLPGYSQAMGSCLRNLYGDLKTRDVKRDFSESCFNATKACAKLKAAVRVDGVADRAMGVALDGKTLYCIAGRSLYALDVAEPLSPKVIGCLDGMDNRRQVAVADGFAYVVSRETGLRIVDVHDPRNMRLRSRYDSVEFATGVDVVGKTVFLSERINGVEAVDVSNPDNPRHLCIRKTGESQSNRYRNGFLYSGEWGGGRVTVFDAHDMRAFREIGTLELGGFGDGLEIDGRYLYCSTGHDARHHRAAQLQTGHRESKVDDLADPTQNSAELVGAGRGLDIFDLADPAKPRHVSRVDFPVFKPRNDDYWTVRVADGLAFCCDSHNGLFIVDVHDPTRPKVIDRFCVPEPGRDWPSGAISSVAVGEGCIYVTSFPGGLWVIPVAGVKPPFRDKGAPPANATVAETYPTDKGKFHVYRPAAAGQARTACVRGDVVYAAFGDAGLHVLRIKPEGGFEKLGELPGGKRVTDCCFVGDRLVTAEGLDGWAAYALDGPTGFREVARRPTTPSSTVAFWCWPAGTRHAVLSSRNGPYHVLGLDDFARPDSLCKFYATCQWDKYLPDALVGDRLAILNPYSGLIWVDFSGPVPKTGAREKRGEQPAGAQVNGICAFGDRYLYTVDDRYQFILPDGSKTELRALPPVPEFQKTNRSRFTGIPRSDGRLVALTNRSGARYAVYDFADPQNPKLLDAGELSGRPDLAAFWNGHVIIPAGHQGLLLTVRRYVGGL